MKSNIFLILLFSSFVLQAQVTQKMPSLIKMLKTDVNNAHEGLKQAQDLFKHINLYIKPASFKDSTNVAIEKDGEGGIWFNFGYAGHGPLNLPFSGFEAKIDFVRVPNWLEGTFKNTLVRLGFSKIINISPQDEFLIKFTLLALDKKNKKLTSRQFITELFFLLYRLVQVKDFPGIKSLLSSVTGPFANLIGKIKINNRDYSIFLDKAWLEFQSIVNYNFVIENKPAFELKKTDLIDSDDWKTIFKILFSIGLKTVVEYYVEREAFIKTIRGIELLNQLNSSQTKLDKVKKISEFNTAMPGYNKIVANARNRLKGFLRRIKGVRVFWNNFVNKLRPILEPFLDDIGIPFDLIFPKLNEVEDTTKLYEGEEFTFEDDFGGEVFGVGEFDFSSS